MNDDTTNATTDRPSAADSSLREVSDHLAAQGYDGQFRAVEGGEVQCLTCRVLTPAGAIVADGARRLEGESDPADMALVVPVRCPACGTAGVLTLAYGPKALAQDIAEKLARKLSDFAFEQRAARQKASRP